MKTDSVERLQRDLREGEFLEDIGDAVAIMDTSFRILYQNSADRELSGDHVGRFCYEAYEFGAEVCAGCPLALVFSDGRTHTSERTSPSLHGSRRLEINASPITDREGRIVAGLEIVRRNFFDFIIPDSARVQVSEVVKLLLTGTLPSRSVNENVTKGAGKPGKQRRAEGPLRESTDKYQLLIDATGTGYVILDERGLATGAVRNLAIDYVGPDGATIPVEINATVQPGPPARIFTVCRDITERKRAEEALREREERLRTLSDASFEAIFVSEKGICLEQNLTAEKLFGYRAAEGRHHLPLRDPGQDVRAPGPPAQDHGAARHHRSRSPAAPSATSTSTTRRSASST